MTLDGIEYRKYDDAELTSLRKDVESARMDFTYTFDRLSYLLNGSLESVKLSKKLKHVDAKSHVFKKQVEQKSKDMYCVAEATEKRICDDLFHQIHDTLRSFSLFLDCKGDDEYHAKQDEIRNKASEKNIKMWKQFEKNELELWRIAIKRIERYIVTANKIRADDFDFKQRKDERKRKVVRRQNARR